MIERALAQRQSETLSWVSTTSSQVMMFENRRTFVASTTLALDGERDGRVNACAQLRDR